MQFLSKREIASNNTNAAFKNQINLSRSKNAFSAAKSDKKRENQDSQKNLALAQEKPHSKTTTIYGLEQGSHLKIPKHASANYRLQVASFEKRANAEIFKNQLAQKIDNPIHIVSSNRMPSTYRVVIGPISDALTVVNLSEQLLANKPHINLAGNTHGQRPLRQPKLMARTIDRKGKRAKAIGEQIAKKSELAKINSSSTQELADENNGQLSWMNNLLTGFSSIPTLSSPLAAATPDDQSIYQSSLTSTASNIESALKNQTNPEVYNVQASSLPNLYTGSFSTTYSENRDEDENWQKNLFIALADEELRTEESEKTSEKKPTDKTKFLLLEKDREDQSSLPVITINSYSSPMEKKAFSYEKPTEQDDEKTKDRIAYESDHKIQPLMQLAEASDATIPLTNPSLTDMQPIDDKLTYVDHGRQVQITLTHYDPKVFLLAYNVFIMNGSIGYAYRIAYSAVSHDPKNAMWREKLAQVALWAGNGEVALEQWMYLIGNRINPEKYIKDALVLSRQIANYDSQSQIYEYLLQQSPQNKELLLDYNISMQKRGYPGKALRMLLDIPNVESDRKFVEQLVAIYKGIDKPEKELYYLQKLAALNPTEVKIKLEQAKILYSRGDLEGAYRIFSETASMAGLNNTNFWDQYASIALLTGHSKVAIIALKNLFNTNVINISAFLQLVQLEKLDGQTLVAYHDSLRAYQINPDIRIVKMIMALGIDLKKWFEIKQFMDSLSVKNFQKLNADPEFAMLIAQINRRVGLPIEAFYNWSRILALWPDLSIVQEGYLWYLIDNHEFRQMKYVLGRWCHILGMKPDLWRVYSASLSDIGDNISALAIAKPHYEEINQDYAKLLATSDLFNQVNHVFPPNQNDNRFEAYYLKRRATYLLMQEIGPNPENLTLRQRLAYSELLRSFAPASVIYNVILKISKDLFKIPEIDDQVIAWALENRSYSLARHIIRAHKQSHSFTPPWMSLTLALEENDRDLMKFLLFDSPDLLPYRDKVTAATRTGNIALAETYAFKGLKEHPLDSEMYDLFEETMLRRADKISASGSYQTWGNVAGPLTKLSYRTFVTPSISLTPYTIDWFPRSFDRQVIFSTPGADKKVGIKARKLRDNGWWELDVGERKSLGRVYPVIAKFHRDNLIARLDGELTLAYNDYANETTALVLGGVKDELKMKLDYDSKSYNRYEAELSFNRYLGQDNTALGSSEILRFHWQHKFYLSYPDWNFNLYGNSLNFHTKDRTLTPLLARIVPPAQDPTSSFYMPVGDINAAATLGFGQNYKEDYTKKWRPFAEAGLLVSKVLGFGQIFEGGFATSIFGRDHLVLFVEYSKNQQQVNQQQQIIGEEQPVNQRQESQVYYNIGISYDYYF